ncbi:YeiH family protein [Aeromicrobium sp. 179-A 4D2 NHS]|uniref:YeiH family protein n=1 Tax=Aeromicrobium sp. 179-A 4D2 NHS TaxID=3142375 RepID=UPI0039A30F4F
MLGPAPPSTRSRAWDAATSLLPLAAGAALAIALSWVLPWVSPLMWGIVLGSVVANVAPDRDRRRTADAARLALRLGIVGLGLQLSLSDVAAVGPRGLLVIATTVVATWSLTHAAGRRWGLEPRLVTLIAAGFSICGAAAIAAVQDAVRARERDVATALALVTLFGTALVVAIPAATHALGLTAEQGAVWAGASIHEVGQVVAAATILGAAVVPTASVVKLGRVVLLAPAYARAARTHRDPAGRSVALVPWFIVGFVVACLVRATGVLPAGTLDGARHTTTFLLAVGMFGLGLDLRLAHLARIPVRAVGLAAFATAVAVTVSGVQVALL